LVDNQGKAEGASLIARQRFVVTGTTRGDQVAVLSGIEAGDTVVTAGQIKLRNGSPIVINNAVQPSDDRDPKPIDR
jgi:membrane fusion protein (multidrug efflux system)